MHEVGIAGSILDAVRQEMARYPAARARGVIVRIGELAAVEPDALRFCFEALKRDTEFEALELKIEFCPRRHRCPVCGAEFIVAGYDFGCPECGQEKTEFASGNQLELASLEIDDYEPSAA